MRHSKPHTDRETRERRKALGRKLFNLHNRRTDDDERADYALSRPGERRKQARVRLPEHSR